MTEEGKGRGNIFSSASGDIEKVQTSHLVLLPCHGRASNNSNKVCEESRDDEFGLHRLHPASRHGAAIASL